MNWKVALLSVLRGVVLAVVVPSLLFFPAPVEAKDGNHSIPFKMGQFEPEVRLPATRVTLGHFYFGEEADSAFGFRIANRTYYLRDSKRPEIPLPAYWNSYGVYKNLLVIGGYEGTTGGNNWLFLFRLGRDHVELLYALHAGYARDLSFDFTPSRDEASRQVGFSDMVGDGKGEVRIDLLDLDFSLFVKADRGLAIDLNPRLYRPLYSKLNEDSIRSEEALRQYSVYGFLSAETTKTARIEDSRRRIDQYYENLLRTARQLPEKKMKYAEVFDYLKSREGEGYEFHAITEVLWKECAPYDGYKDGGDIVRFIEKRREDEIKTVRSIFAAFPTISKGFRPEGKISLRLYGPPGRR